MAAPHTPRVLILGATGMLGHKLFQGFQDRFDDVIGTCRTSHAGLAASGPGRLVDGIDVTERRELFEFLDDAAPDAVVNCVGIIKQRHNGQITDEAVAINSLLPRFLAHWANERGCRLLHVSTDCVYSGRRGHYTEHEMPDPVDSYGRTKYLGEPSGPGVLTIRTSIVGRELSHFTSLIEWFRSQEGGSVRGYRNALFSGVTTNELTAILGDVIAGSGLRGLYHISGPVISKLDLLTIVRDGFGLNIDIIPDDEVVIDRSLDSTAFQATTGYRPTPWKEMIETMVADPTPYDQWTA